MAEDQKPTPGQPYDLEMVRQLAELMREHDLSEIDLRKDTGRLRLRRGPQGLVTALPAAMPQAAPQALPAATAATPALPEKNLVLIKSEAIGTFYSKPKPEAEPYVKIGTRITPTTVVGLIEAMKLFNEVPAGCSGVVVEVCVENQQAVEYGTVMFKVDPAG